MVLPRFLAELKRRKVYRVALVYAGVGWALLEAADVVLPRLALPDWTVNVVLAVVLLGFPLALVFAWIFEVSPQGIVRTEPLSPEGHQHQLSVTAIVEFALIVALVAAVGGLYLDRLSLQKRLTEAESVIQQNPVAGQPVVPHPERYRAIAVLPFADMSEAGDQAWFAEGIAEELLIALSQVKPLSVMARTSSFAFQGTDKTVAEIADILGVQAVLEGSVRRSQDRVRITAQLVDARSGFHIWSGSYERQITDIFQLQDELARSVVQALRIELRVVPAAPLVVEQTRVPEAYNWFMRGRALLDWGNLKSTLKSIAYFENAVEQDPEYVQAWGYLALARASMLFWRPTAEAAPGAVAAYRRALTLDPSQPEALTAKAWIIRAQEWDFDAAASLYHRALKTRENTNAMVWYNMFLFTLDLLEPAIRNQRVIEHRDPLQAGYKATLANFLLWNGDIEAAAAKARESLELNPQHIFALYAFIDSNTLLGNYAQVEAMLASLSREILAWPPIKCRIAIYQAVRGNFDQARRIYDELMLDPSSANYPYLAHLALRLDEVEAAIDIMERAVAMNTWHANAIRSPIIRQFDTVGSHPRYLALLDRVGLDDESVAELVDKYALDQPVEELSD